MRTGEAIGHQRPAAPQRRGRPGLTDARKVLVVAVLALATAAFVAVAAVGHGYFDLHVYHGAVNYWVHDRGEIYDFLKPESKYGFTYPPFAAMLMLPMAYLGWHPTIVISVVLAVVSFTAVLWWMLDPIAQRHGWSRWFVLAVGLCLAAAFEPICETVDFGQVNAVLLLLVAADMLGPLARNSRWAGVGIGLATAIKLTPGVFLLYLLVTGRWRAAAVATGTAAGATLFAAAVYPDASREFWTQALWNTDRVGSLSFISNQSLQGVVARLNPEHPWTPLWLLLVVATLAVWAVRCRRAVAQGPGGRPGAATGLALTGVLQCLLSPVTWVHHLVWLTPALILLLDRALDEPSGSRRRRRLLWLAGLSYVVLSSRLVWIWRTNFNGVLGFVGANAYVWISIALLLALPLHPAGAGVSAAAAAPIRAASHDDLSLLGWKPRNSAG